MKIYSQLHIQNYTEFDGVFLVSFDHGYEHYDPSYPLSRIECDGAELTVETERQYWDTVKNILDYWLAEQPGVTVIAGEEETLVFDPEEHGFKVETSVINTLKEH